MGRIANLSSERGAVLIQTAVAALVLVGFGTFVVDYGVLWAGRHQAQNAADAGAMAGALARAYEDFDDDPPPDPAGVAAETASQIASANSVWGVPATAVTSFACPLDDPAGRCVRVDVYRNGENGSSALPRWFAPLLGVDSQGVKATATARVLIPNTTDCLRPWAIPDKWIEGSVPADPSFKKYEDGSGAELAPHDEYAPPTSTDVGTGMTFATSNSSLGELGTSFALTFDDLTIPANKIFRTSVVPLELTGGYESSRLACNGQQISIGDQIPISATLPGALDFGDLITDDTGASWNSANITIDGSCAPGCAALSPRLVAVALFDVDMFQYRRAVGDWTACPPGRAGCAPCAGGPCVSVVNIVGLFVGDATPVVYLTSHPGLVPAEPPKLTAASSFLKAVTLVR